jgi:hypothetical protein
MTKYKVNINRPEVSQDEIVEKRDFNFVLKKYKREKGKFIKVNWIIIYILIAVILICVFLSVRIIKEQENRGNKKNSFIMTSQDAAAYKLSLISKLKNSRS